MCRAKYLLVIFLCLPACGQSDSYFFVECDDTVTAAYAATSSSGMSGASFLYQLQNAVPSSIAGTSFDIVVMDYSSDGSDAGAYSAAEVGLIHDSGKTVLAYLSIGEAEDYRFYFDDGWVSHGQPDGDAPCWLNRTNRDWEGNYKVQYWSSAWQDIVLDYLDDIVAAGFDGVYLDIIDGFEYWSDSDNGEGYYISESESAARMINLVARIAWYARNTLGVTGFLIVPQNGEGILEYDGDDVYKNVVDGIGIEDLYYDETDPIDASITSGRRYYIDQLSKPVLVTDYVDDGTHDGIVMTFRSAASGNGYIPYAARTDRELSVINTFTGQP